MTGSGGQPGVAARTAALRALGRIRRDAAWSQPAVRAVLDRAGLPAEDRALAAALTYETLRWEGTLDWALAQVSSRPLGKVEPVVADALRLGAWQLLYGRQPDRAAVSTTVAAAGQVAGKRVTGFVNGVLRGLARARDHLPWPDPATDEGLGLRLGYPAWIVAAARERFAARAEAVLAAGNAAPGVMLRATGGPEAREALLAELRAAGLQPEPAPYAAASVHLGSSIDPDGLACVREGRAVVQDEASTLVGAAAGAAATGAAAAEPAAMRAVDACAAPGGKAGHLAEQGLEVLAADRHAGRTRALAAALVGRAGSAPLRAVVADGRALPLPDASADLVLVDAPCTGLGVVRRRPELRWRVDPQDPEALAGLQRALVAEAARVVAPGGVVCYSVCTWTVAETVAVVRGVAAAATPPESALTPVSVDVAGAGTSLPGDPGVQLAPDQDGTDGMYLHCWRRDGGTSGPAGTA